MKQKKARLASHRPVVSGCRKIHVLVLVSVRTATTIDHPEAVNDMLKSTLPILLAVIVTSLTTMSALCSHHWHETMKLLGQHIYTPYVRGRYLGEDMGSPSLRLAMRLSVF
jgi:hypothetical protein